MLDQKNSKMQGNVGLGRCIAWATSLGYTVSIPLNDAQGYDLVIDDGANLLKVQVKTCRCRDSKGRYRVDLKNNSYHTYKTFDNTTVDFLFVLLDDGTSYWIPCSDITTITEIKLGGTDCKFRGFLV